jgi:hypothetical protein
MNYKRSNEYELINLKLDLHNLNVVTEQLNKKCKIKLDSIKRLEENHEQKRIQFVNRVKFFDNFLLTDLINKKIKSLRNEIDSTQKLNQELDVENIKLKQELDGLKLKKEKLNKKLLRYLKFFEFLNSPVLMNHFSKDPSLIIDRYESLILTKDEIQSSLDERLNELARIKNDLRLLLSSDDEYLITTYETKNLLSNNLCHLKENMIELNQLNLNHFDVLNKTKLTNYRIELVIDYLYNLICLMRFKRNRNKSIVSHQCASSISLFKKLDVIQYNLNHFSELAKLNF